MKWNTRAEAKEFIENSYPGIDDKPIVVDSSRRSDHCARYICLCQTFCLEIKRKKKKGKVNFVVDERKSNIEHLIWSNDVLGNPVQTYCNPSGIFESERCFTVTEVKKKQRTGKSYFFNDNELPIQHQSLTKKTKFIERTHLASDSEDDEVTFSDAQHNSTPQKNRDIYRSFSELTSVVHEPPSFVETPISSVLDQEKLTTLINHMTEGFVQDARDADREETVNMMENGQECFTQMSLDIEAKETNNNGHIIHDQSLSELNVLWNTNGSVVSLAEKLSFLPFKKLPTLDGLQKLDVLLEGVRAKLTQSLASATTRMSIRTLQSGFQIFFSYRRFMNVICILFRVEASKSVVEQNNRHSEEEELN